MNLNNNIFTLQHLIYNKPWMILPSSHEILRNQVENAISNNIQLPDDEETEDDEMPMDKMASIAIISIDGIVGKRVGLLESLFGWIDVDDISEQLDVVTEDSNIQTVIMY